jgi:hypothetical protein
MASKPRFSSAIQVYDREIRYDSQQITKSAIMFFDSARKLTDTPNTFGKHTA